MSSVDMSVLYRTAGEAVHMGQALELNLTVLIELLNRGYDANIETREIVLEDNKRTLGQLIALLKKRGSASPETSQALTEALEARNYIAHHFFLRVVDAFHEPKANAAALELLNTKLKQVMVGTAITQAFVEGFTQSLGRNLSDVRIRQDI